MILKGWQALSLCAGISLIALFSTMFLLVGIAKTEIQFRPDSWTMETDYYNNKLLTAPISEGDCGMGSLYPSPWTNTITTYLVSASPSSGYTIYVGCVYPINGNPNIATLHAPGHGPTCSSPQYAIWGNGGTTDETCNFKVTYWTSND